MDKHSPCLKNIVGKTQSISEVALPVNFNRFRCVICVIVGDIFGRKLQTSLTNRRIFVIRWCGHSHHFSHCLI